MKIEGLIAATFGTFQEDGSLNLAIIPSLVEKLIADGLRGVFICGTNGEGPNLTVEERMAVAEAYVQAANKRILVLVHLVQTSIADSRKLAAHAARIGADAISSVAAFYFKPTSVQNLAESMAQIASAAPQLPFYYYHIPTLTGVGLDMIEFLRLGEELIPNLAGIKYTAATLHEYQACVNYQNGRFDILFGFDEMLLPALAVGAKGAIGSTYTYAAPLYLKVVELFGQGKIAEARQMQLQSVEMVRCLVKYPPIPAQRAIMKMQGFDLGTCRLPLKGLSEQDTLAFRASLDEMSFFELLNQLKGQQQESQAALPLQA